MWLILKQKGLITMAKQTYNVLKPREYTTGNGEVKKHFVEVGAAWDIDSGGMSIEIHEGISISGKVLILPRKERDAPNYAE